MRTIHLKSVQFNGRNNFIWEISQKADHLTFFLYVLRVEGEKFDTCKVLKQCPISSIFSLLIYWKENHGKSERVYASRRGS